MPSESEVKVIPTEKQEMTVQIMLMLSDIKTKFMY